MTDLIPLDDTEFNRLFEAQKQPAKGSAQNSLSRDDIADGVSGQLVSPSRKLMVALQMMTMTLGQAQRMTRNVPCIYISTLEHILLTADDGIRLVDCRC